MGRQHQGMDRPGVLQVPESSGEQGKMGETGCEIMCGAPTTLAVKGEMRERVFRCYTVYHDPFGFYFVSVEANTE